MHELRVTYRALTEDFELDAGLLVRPVEDYCDEHPVLKAFVERRSQSPTGQEVTRLPRNKQTVYNLHVDRYRALTWHDEDEDVVWLLGFGYHESGSRDDAYEVLKALDAKDVLLPDDDDYRILYRYRIDRGVSTLPELIRVVERRGPDLLGRALTSNGATVTATYANALNVSIVVEEEQDDDIRLRTYRITFEMPPLRSGILPSGQDWQLLLIFAFLPDDADVGDLEWRTDATGDTIIYRELLAAT